MAENKHTISDLYQMQALPLSAKIRMTERRIMDWIDYYGTNGVYISFSGGKDSTVLMDIVRNKLGYKNIPAVFVDVPTQYPELKEFALTWDNVEVLRPKISFAQVCEKYGFPLISKEVSGKVYEASMKKGGYAWMVLHGEKNKGTKFDIQKWCFMLDAPFQIHNYCCNAMKKNPIKKYEHETKRYGITAQMASESKVRTTQWLQYGCNAFDKTRPISNPMSFWTEQDILTYLLTYGIKICSVYGDIVEDLSGTDEVEGQLTISDIKGYENVKLFDAEKPPLKTTGCKRTGCMLCGFGCHLEKPGDGRFERLKQTHTKMYNLLDVIKNNGVTFREAIEWINENGNLNIRL